MIAKNEPHTEGENIFLTDMPEETAAPVPKKRRSDPPAKKPNPSGKKRRKKKKKKKKNPAVGIALLAVLVLLMAVGGAVAFGAYKVSLIDTVYPGVEVAGIDLGGLTHDEAAYKLMELGAEKYDGLAVTGNLPLEHTLTISAWEAGLTYSADRAADAAWRYGRGGGMLADTLAYFRARLLHSNSFVWEGEAIDAVVDEAVVRSIVAEAARDVNAKLLESGIEYGDREIRITKGAIGLEIDENTVAGRFIDALLSGEGTPFTYESEPRADESFDFQALYDELYSERADAVILWARDYGLEPESTAVFYPEPTSDETEGETAARVVPPLPEGFDFEGKPYGITRSSVGVSFDVAAAESAWNAAGYGEVVTIPLDVDEPEYSTEELEAMLFADNLSKNWTMVRLYKRDYSEEVRTSLAGSTKNRINNVRKACELINGIILMPGEAFTYNGALGERVEADGWLPAPAYANGEVRQEYGGGICQVSSTLYNAVMYANLDIMDRSCHQFKVGYLPPGMDATVSWGSPDFVFRNDKDYPIRIVAWVDDETMECCVQIQGTDTEHQYVIIKFYEWKIDEAGEATSGDNAVGTAAWTQRLVFNDGDDYNTATPVSQTYESWSKYRYHDE